MRPAPKPAPKRRAAKCQPRRPRRARSLESVPLREQLECRLAALTGALAVLLELLDNERDLDAAALRQADQSAERLQNAINVIELRSR